MSNPFQNFSEDSPNPMPNWLRLILRITTFQAQLELEPGMANADTAIFNLPSFISELTAEKTTF